MAFLYTDSESNAYDAVPGSPDWWLKKLACMLMDRRDDFDERAAYVEGRHPVPNGDPRYRKVLQDLQYKARTNYCGLIASAPVERMRVRGFRFGPPGETDVDAQKIWNANNMELLATQLHTRAAKYGVAYALVEPPPEGLPWPRITLPDPRSCIAYRDPRQFTVIKAGLEMWVDDLDNTVKAIVYLPGTAYAYQGPSAQRLASSDNTEQAARVLFGIKDGFRPAGTVTIPLDEVPLVEYVWRPDSDEEFPEGEVDEGLRDIQDRINHTILDRLVISKNQAYRQRFVTGYPVPKNKKARQRPPFDPGSDMLWVTDNPDAKFGEFATADIRQILEAVRDDIGDMAAISKTPPHYLMGKVSNVSGETLTQATDGLVQKTKQRMVSMGYSHEDVMKKCFKYLGQAEKARDVEAAVLWEDPNTYTMAELSDAGLKWSSTQIPLDLIMERQGWTPDQIAYAVQKQAEMQAKQDALQQQQLTLKAQAPGPNDTTNNKQTNTKTPGGSKK